MNAKSVIDDLKSVSDPKKIPDYQRFFKTEKGQYGEGDIFIGVTVPKSRVITKKYKDLTLSEISKLLASKIHEVRLVALMILVVKFKQASTIEKEQIANFYLQSTKFINNWDLVDVTAPKIVGAYLYENPKAFSILQKLASSKNLWERRISIISTLYFIVNSKFDKTLKISEILLNDKHDLIHKAVGWMLREVGKRDKKVEEEFLKKNYKRMPRTMLRYAIEKFPEDLRKKYLLGKI